MHGREFLRTATTTAAALLLPGTALAQEPSVPAPEPVVEEPVRPAGVEITVKPGKGITFEQEGDYKLRLRGRFQALAVGVEDDGEVETEALIRRARLVMDGYVWNEDITYKMELAFAPRDLDETGSPVLDAWIELTHLRDLQLRAGLYKIPFDRQRVISSGDLQFVDRSPILSETTLDRDFGLTLHSGDLFGLDERFGYALGLYSGDGRGRVTAPGGFLYLARAEVRPFGGFDDYTEADIDFTPTPKLAIAGTVAWNENAIRQNSNRGSAFREELDLIEDFEGFDYLHLEADAIFKWSGFSALAEFIWRDERGGEGTFTGAIDDVGFVNIPPRNAWGWFVQAGQMVTRHVEVAARYSEQHALSGAPGGLLEDVGDTGREAGAAVSWYVHGHQLKLQADYFRQWGNEVESEVIDERSFADGANQVRVQLQAAW